MNPINEVDRIIKAMEGFDKKAAVPQRLSQDHINSLTAILMQGSQQLLQLNRAKGNSSLTKERVERLNSLISSIENSKGSFERAQQLQTNLLWPQVREFRHQLESLKRGRRVAGVDESSVQE